MRILLTGGGSGGHIYPALTIADEIRRQAPETEFLYMGVASGLEADLVPRAGLPFKTIRAGGLVGRGTAAKASAALQMGLGVIQSIRVLRRFRPDVVLATGGFVSGPVLLAARVLGVPYALWEGNAFPGSTIRLFSRGARAVFVPFPEARRHFPAGVRLHPFGNPVRREVLQAQRPEARAAMGFGSADQVVLTFGGSQGALGIHQALVDAAPRLTKRSNLRLVHVTGPRLYDRVAQMYREAGLDPDRQEWLQLVPYMYDMPTALAAADLAITRAGATTMAELAARGLPAILIPFPHSTHDHQVHNARALESRGAAMVILQPDLTGSGLAGAVLNLLDDPDRRARMAQALGDAAWPEAGRLIAAEVLRIARG